VSFGITITGQHGFTQIDSNFKNLAFRQKATLTFNNSTHEASFTWSNGVTPLVCWRGSTPAALMRVDQSGSSFTYTFRKPVGASGSVEYFLFDTAAQAATSFGLNIYAPDGSVAFAGDLRYPKILGVYQVPNSGSGNLSATLTPGNYAGCLSLPRMGQGGVQIQPGVFQHMVGLDTMTVTSTSLSVQFDQSLILLGAAGGFNYAVRQNVGGQVLLIDVTGL
jgi:hypothetical protein